MKTIIESYHAGLFQRKWWLPNIVSGMIVGVVALPLAMAFAIASGAKPEQGLYTAIVAGFIVSIFGGSRLQIAGPTGAFIVVLASITHKYGIDGLQIATMLAGFMLFFFGLARFGAIIQFIPAPVIIGFTSGIAIVIWVGQWQYFFGLPNVAGTHFHEKLWHLLQVLPQLNITTTMLAITSLLVVIYGNKLPPLKQIPGPLLALVFATFIQALFQFKEVATIGSAFGGIPLGLPTFQLPPISFDRILELMGPAFTIAMLGSIESLLSAVVADGMTGTRHDSNQELIGQGLANMATPLFGGFAATGAIARTATNIRNGANSPLAGIIHSLTLVLIILCLAPLAVNVPLSALAAILFVVAWNMSEVKHFIKLIQRSPVSDVIILLVTFLLTVFVDLVVAVNIGVSLAILQFLFSMARSIEVELQTGEQLASEFPQLEAHFLPSDIMVYSMKGPFFFGAIEHVESVMTYNHPDPRVLIVRFNWVPFIDGSGLQSLEKIIRTLQERGVRVMVAGANTRVEKKLREAGIICLLGPDNFANHFSPSIFNIIE